MVEWNNNIAKLTLPTPYAVGDVNVYLVKGDALTLFDTGVKTKESKEALEYQLGELHLKIADIEQIMLTHHHPDHAAALDFFHEDVPVYGHENNQRWLDLHDDFFELHNRFFLDYADNIGVEEELKKELVRPTSVKRFLSQRKLTRFLKEGDELPALPGWKVIESLGHAQSHLSFFREKDGIMIGGDHLLDKVSPNPLMEPPLHPGEERPKPLLQYNESLKKWMDLPISKVYSGHGADVINVNETIAARMKRQHERAMKVKKMLEAGPLTPFEICQQLFPKVYQSQVGLTLSETIGQLDYLEDLGEVHSESQSGLTLYYIA